MQTKTIDNIWFESFMRDMWSSGEVFEINGKEYTMHKMSYGDYFAEPKGWQGGELAGFSPGTLWFEKFLIDHKVYYKLDNLLNK